MTVKSIKNIGRTTVYIANGFLHPGDSVQLEEETLQQPEFKAHIERLENARMIKVLPAAWIEPAEQAAEPEETTDSDIEENEDADE